VDTNRSITKKLDTVRPPRAHTTNDIEDSGRADRRRIVILASVAAQPEMQRRIGLPTDLNPWDLSRQLEL